MDKVIDGVDVSGCEFSCENPLHEIKHSCNVRGYEKDNGLHIHLQCKNNPNCYYKQLKRAKVEIEELKKTVLQKCPNCNEEYLSPIGAKLYAENERLKARLRPLEDSYFKGLSSIQIAELAKKSISKPMRTSKKRYFISYTYIKENNIGFGSCINNKGPQKIKDMEKEIMEKYEYDSAIILNVLPEYIEISEDTDER